MPVLSQGLSADGAVVEMLVGVHQARRDVLVRNNLPVPARVPVLLQIDTGSDVTAVHGDIFARLGIQPIDTVRLRPMSTSAGAVEFPRYAVSLGLRDREFELHLPSTTVLGCHMTPDERVQGILGRDVLEHCLFVYDGQRRAFMLAF